MGFFQQRMRWNFFNNEFRELHVLLRNRFFNNEFRELHELLRNWYSL